MLVKLGASAIFIDKELPIYLHFLFHNTWVENLYLGNMNSKLATKIFASLTKILVKARVNINAQDIRRNTFLHHSALADNFLATFYLMHDGAKTDIQNNHPPCTSP